MDAFSIYQDIQMRTNGQFLIGVVGPVRTGKSTFIRRFLEVLALPELDEKTKAEVQDALPLSGSGKLITTVEPKFVPKDAVSLQLGDGLPVKLRLIDCVGFLVPGASGNMEEDKERMVKTPWSEKAIPFREAAEIGTKKVIAEHSTIGIMVTCDGSFGEIPRDNFLAAEEQTVKELQKQRKPFVILVNSQKPYKKETEQLVRELEEKYHAPAMAVNCDQLRKEDIVQILEKILYEFPISEMSFLIPKWVELLSLDHPLKKELLEKIRTLCSGLRVVRDLKKDRLNIDSEFVRRVLLQSLNLADGTARIQIEVKEQYYYEMLTSVTGISIRGEYDLMRTLKELSSQKKEYEKVADAISSVRASGYGVVIPGKEEIHLEDPVVIHQGNKYGVKIKSTSPSIHMIKADIETEIAPIVGSEQQAEDLIRYIKENSGGDNGIWEISIFGKSVEQLVEDGIRTKIAQITEDSQTKLQNSMQKIVNDSKGGMVCIII